MRENVKSSCSYITSNLEILRQQSYTFRNQNHINSYCMGISLVNFREKPVISWIIKKVSCRCRKCFKDESTIDNISRQREDRHKPHKRIFLNSLSIINLPMQYHCSKFSHLTLLENIYAIGEFQ